MALKDITLGQYYPVDSKIHELDARTKILAVFAYLVSLFLIKSFTGFGVAALFLFICVKMSKVPFSFVTRSLPLVAINSEAFVLPSRPQFSKVSLICLFSSSRSVSTTMVGEPANLRRIFCARNTME